MQAGLLRFGILGAFECSDARGPLVVDQPKPRALLALLVLDANSVVPAGRLIDDLWARNPPRSATNTLQTYVHRLRALLPPDTLVTRDGGYVLLVDPESVDATRFETLVASPAARDANPSRRVEALRDALRLWRGDALGDFGDAEWTRPAIARLEEARLRALERCIEAELELGRQGELLGELTELVRRHPFRERLSAFLMLALYREGRQADALGVSQHLRRTLVEELGIEPSETVVELERAILLQDPNLDAVAARSGIEVPLSARMIAASSGPFVGRALELATLEAAFKDVVSGGRATVLISGEPGIGKTSLAAVFARNALDAPATVLHGHSDVDLGIPYQPWSEALAYLVAHTPQAVLDAHVAVHGGVLARLVPELVERATVPVGTTDDIDSQRHRLFGAVADLLARAAAIAPIIVLIDDMHWADRATVDLLHFLVALDRSLGVLIVATFRDSEVGPHHPLADVLAAFARQRDVRRVQLAGLDDDELLALLEATAGDALPGRGIELRDELMRDTDGNPFFVIEVLRDFADTADDALDPMDRSTIGTRRGRRRGPPVAVREVIANRVARLGRDEARALSVASVVGREFDLELLGRAAELDVITATGICERSVDAAVLEATEVPGRYAFSHALIQQTLYENLGATVRHQLHRRIGETLEALHRDGDAHIPELAHHWLSGNQPADAARALHYARRAGDLALAGLAPDDAVGWYRQALELLGRQPEIDDRSRCALLVGLGRAQAMAGDGDARATLLDAGVIADRIGAPDLLIEAALATTRGDFSQVGGEDAELTALTTAALAAAGAADSPDRVRLLAALMEHAAGSDWELARARATAAVDAALRLGDDNLLMETVTCTYVARAQPDTLPRRLADTALALALADAVGDSLQRFNARFTRHIAVMEAADIGEADRLLTEMEEIATASEITLPIVRLRLLMTRAGRLVLAGDLAAAEQTANELLGLGATTNLPDAFAAGGALLTLIGSERGRVGETIDLFRAAVEQNPDFAVLRAAVAFYYSELGRLDDARAVLDRERASGFRAIPFDMNWTTSLTLFADCAAALGDRAAAVMIRNALAPFASSVVYNGLTSLGALSRVLGRLDALLGDAEGAERHYRHALDLNGRLRAPFPTARTQLDYADLLSRRPEPDCETAAAGFADAAARTAAQHGYLGLHERAGVLLDRLAPSLRL